MAEDIIFKVGIDSDGSGAKSLKSLKAEFKQLQQELEKTQVGTTSYQKALEKLGAVRDDIGDLNQEINALNPEGKVQAFANIASGLASGFQAATGAAALFGVESKELEKTLLRVQAATAFAQGIQGVIGMADAFKVLGTVIAANPIMFLSAAILGIVAATAAWINATDEETVSLERLNDQLDRQKESIDQINKANQLYVRQLKANGATEKEILEENIKQAESNYERLEKLAKIQLQILNKAGEDERAAENKKYIDMYQDLIEADIKIKQARVDLANFNINQAKKEALDSANEAAKINSEFYKQQLADRELYEKMLFEIEAMSWDSFILPYKIKKAADEIKLVQQTEEQKRNEAKKTKDFIDATDAEMERRKRAREQAEIDIDKNYWSAVSDLSATFFNFQLASVKGNAVEEEKIRKKQFQVNKAFSATKATIEGINAVQGILGQSLLYGPATIPLAISMGVATAANVAKILSTQYNSGVQTNAQTNINSNAPQIQTNAPQTISQPLTRLNEQGQNLSAPIRAYVVETDVSESQERVRRLQEQNTF